MPIKYILDTREKSLQNLFTKNNVSYETKQLDLGDIIILYSKGEIKNINSESENAMKLLGIEEKVQQNTEKIHSIVIERKSYKDLKASMSDKRYHEQKSRYIQLPKGTVYYIFENNDPEFKELNKKQFVGAYIHTMVRDNISVILTNSIEETFEYLIKVGDTIEKFGIKLDTQVYNINSASGGLTNNSLASGGLTNNNSASGELNTNTKDECNNSSSSEGINNTDLLQSSQIKKKKYTGKDIYKQQIMCINGISSGKASLIADVYPDMKSLISSIETDTFKVKGIGKVLFNNIKESLLYNK